MIETKIIPKVDFLFTPVINYAIQQNKVSLVRKLSVENPFDEDLADVQVKIECEPEFASSWEHQIYLIPSNQPGIRCERFQAFFAFSIRTYRENSRRNQSNHICRGRSDISKNLFS